MGSEGTPGPASRIGEFVRQYSRMSGLDQEQVTSVHSDPGAEMASLLVEDLRAVVEALEDIRRVACRLDLRSPFAPDGLQYIVDRAHAMLRGQHMARQRVASTGIANPGEGPYYLAGGGNRTRTCGHCGRTCGDLAGGWGVVLAVPVCHPNEGGRPDCYHLATTDPNDHPLRSCLKCTFEPDTQTAEVDR
jgi:hypothetical protein